MHSYLILFSQIWTKQFRVFERQSRFFSITHFQPRRAHFPSSSSNQQFKFNNDGQHSSNNNRHSNFAQQQQNTEKSRALRAAIIGCPNVGKSALTNALVRSPVCAVSKLIDTTRANTTTALTENECQLVVVDSPGLVSLSHAKNVVGIDPDDRLLAHPEKAIERAEQIVVVQDATAKGDYLQHRILYMLHRFSHIPACLVLNKIDLVDYKAELLRVVEMLTEGIVDGQQIRTKQLRMGIVSSIITKARKERGELSPTGTDEFNIRPKSAKIERDEKWHTLYNHLLQKPAHRASWRDTRTLFGNQQGWPYFKAVFFVSAKTDEGIGELREYLRKNAVARPWKYSAETISKKDPRLLCAEHVRSALLNNLPSNVAYKLRVGIAEWAVDGEEEDEINGGKMMLYNKGDDKMLQVAVNVFCENDREARLVWFCTGLVERTQREHLQTLFNRPVRFRLLIRVKGKRGVYLPNEAAEEWRKRRIHRKLGKKAEKRKEEEEKIANEEEIFS